MTIMHFLMASCGVSREILFIVAGIWFVLALVANLRRSRADQAEPEPLARPARPGGEGLADGDELAESHRPSRESSLSPRRSLGRQALALDQSFRIPGRGRIAALTLPIRISSTGSCR